MRPGKTDQIVMLGISALILISISAVYIRHHYIDHAKLSCRSYLDGVMMALRQCEEQNCQAISQLVSDMPNLDFNGDSPHEGKLSEKYETLYQQGLQACTEVK